MVAVSIIVPIGPEEEDLAPLLKSLLALPAATELIFCCCSNAAELYWQAELQAQLPGFNFRFLTAPQGRASQMNTGANAATGDYLWFVHADSHFEPTLWQALQQALQQYPQALHYCRLGFDTDGPALIWLNQWGANLRSRLLGVPFGDQGFCLSRERFDQLAGYPESVAYGEDHLLVWRARQQGVPLHGIPATLWTSARKYRQQGWLRLTLKYQWLWLRQALPELIRCFRPGGNG